MILRKRFDPGYEKGESMKYIHVPRIDARYWTGITLASVFGTNLGDFYAHESGLGIVQGLAVLALLAAIVFVIERFEQRRHQAYYWLVIILIRTGATNIADYLAYRARVPELSLTLGLVAPFRFPHIPRFQSCRRIVVRIAENRRALLASDADGWRVWDSCRRHMRARYRRRGGVTGAYRCAFGRVVCWMAASGASDCVVLDDGGSCPDGRHSDRRLVG